MRYTGDTTPYDPLYNPTVHFSIHFLVHMTYQQLYGEILTVPKRQGEPRSLTWTADFMGSFHGLGLGFRGLRFRVQGLL